MTGEQAAGRAAGSDSAVPAAPPGQAVTPGLPVRGCLIDAVLGRDPASSQTLAAFLAETCPAQAMLRWFGAGLQGVARPGAGAGTSGWTRRLLQAIDRDLAWIDRLMTAQVNAILHHGRLQQLEASWRGLAYLTRQAEPDPRIRIRVLDIGWAELCRDLERAIEFDQSQLFAKVYSEEFGMPGGEPFGVLIGDYEVQHRRDRHHPTDDVAALKGISQVAAAAFAPFIVGASPIMLGIESFSDLAVPIDLSATFRHIDYTRWHSFQDTEDARFVGITLPRVLMRLPYSDSSQRRDGFRFREAVEARGTGNYVWGPAVYAFAAVLIRAFTAHGWFADIRGTQRDSLVGGLVQGLPVPDFATDSPGIAMRYSTDMSVSERQEMELSSLGFIPLSKCKDTEYSVFYSNQSAQKPKRYDRAVATTNARLSSMLQYIICVSRFSHFIKIIGRDRIGSFSTPEECQDFLQRWLMKYHTAADDGSHELKARYPLREARVEVREQPGRPGTYVSTIHLKPHFQLDQVVSTFKLVTVLAGPRA